MWIGRTITKILQRGTTHNETVISKYLGQFEKMGQVMGQMRRQIAGYSTTKPSSSTGNTAVKPLTRLS